MQFFYNLDLADELHAVVDVCTESLDVLDGHDLIRNETLSLVHLAVAALSNFFQNVIEFFKFCH